MSDSIIKLIFVAFVVFIVGCENDRPESKPHSQVVASVNGSELTIHQLNLEFSSRAITAISDKNKAQQRALNNLINQALLEEQAYKLKIDRKPIVMLALERAKRQVLAQAYIHNAVASSISPLTDSDISGYFNSHPELFSERRVYSISEFIIRDDIKSEEITPFIDNSKSEDDVRRSLNRSGISFYENKIEHGAESVPVIILDKLKGLKAGKGIFINDERKRIVWLLSAEDAPFDLVRATPLIKSFLEKQQYEVAIEHEIQRLRKNSNIVLNDKFSSEIMVSNRMSTPEIRKSEELKADNYIDSGIVGLQ